MQQRISIGGPTLRYSESYKGIYVGVLLGEKRDGLGVRIGGNRKGIYFGEFKNGKKHGSGTSLGPGNYNYPGFKYTGEWKEGKKHGQGRLEFNNAKKYVGEFLNNKPQVVMAHSLNENQKNGWWLNENFIGPDEPDTRDGRCVEGKVNCEYDQGIWEYSDGSRYIGSFRRGLRDYGTMIYPNGEKESGRWQRDTRHGSGWLAGFRHDHQGYLYGVKFNTALPDGIEGKCIEGNCKNGKGKLLYADGSIYTGEFSRKKPQGQGVIVYSDGYKYGGRFNKGKKDGKGTINYLHSGRYLEKNEKVGFWKRDRYLGEHAPFRLEE